MNVDNLGENIRFYRKKQGFTQATLAERLGVSFQSVSSWETGTALPDMTNFCQLCALLHIGADELLAPLEPEEKCVIGIDGGGTKTAFVLCSASGRILRSCRLSGSNPSTVGLERTLEVLREGLETCLTADVSVSGIFAGMAGANQSEITAYVHDRFPKIPFSIDSDAVNVLAAGDANLGMLCGTGSIVLAREGNVNHFLGGWGYRWGDPCSAYNLGREAIRASIFMEEHAGPDTHIRAFLCEKAGIASGESVKKHNFYDGDWVSYVASLSTTVFAAASIGDETAMAILDSEVRTMIGHVNTARRLYDCGSRVAAAGGVIEHNVSILMPLMEKYALPGTEFVLLSLPPVYGACVEACRRFDIKTAPTFGERFTADLRNGNHI